MDDYPLLDLMLTMLWVYIIIAWFWFLITLMSDALNSRDLSGPAKAAWTVFLLFVPFIAAVAYLVMRGDSMHERRVSRAPADETASPASAPSTAEEIAKLAALRDSGALTEDEFTAQKSRVLAT